MAHISKDSPCVLVGDDGATWHAWTSRGGSRYSLVVLKGGVVEYSRTNKQGPIQLDDASRMVDPTATDFEIDWDAARVTCCAALSDGVPVPFKEKEKWTTVTVALKVTTTDANVKADEATLTLLRNAMQGSWPTHRLEIAEIHLAESSDHR